MTRATGATEEQIKRALDTWCSFNEFREMNRDFFALDAEQWAQGFVRPDQRIVEVADLKRLLAISRVDTGDLIDRITALIGDAE